MTTLTEVEELIEEGWKLKAVRNFANLHAEVELLIPTGIMLLGGMPGDQEANEKRPYKERREELIAAAAGLTELTVPNEPILTVFRRHPDTGALCLSAGQIRSAIAEVAKANWTVGEAMALQRGARGNFAVEPTLIPILRDGKPLTEPDGIGDKRRPINKPPHERSVIIYPERVSGPLTLAFECYIVRTASVGGKAISDPGVLHYLFEYMGGLIGLGSHRGIDDNGHFIVLRCEITERTPAMKAPTIQGRTKKVEPQKVEPQKED